MCKFLLRIIPKRIKNSILQNYKIEIEKKYEKYLLSIKVKQFDLPRLDLNEKHIKNLKIIEDRSRLLDFLPKNSVVAELGVDTGDFSKLIISKTNPAKIHLIDSWDNKRFSKFSNSKKETVIARFEKEIENNLVKLNIGDSVQILYKLRIIILTGFISTPIIPILQLKMK